MNILFKQPKLGQADLYWSIQGSDSDSNGLKCSGWERKDHIRLTEMEQETGIREDTVSI